MHHQVTELKSGIKNKLQGPWGFLLKEFLVVLGGVCLTQLCGGRCAVVLVVLSVFSPGPRYTAMAVAMADMAGVSSG